LESAVPRARSRFHPRPASVGPGVLTGLHPVREALRARRRSLHRLHLKGAPRPEWEDLRALARESGTPVVESAGGTVDHAPAPTPWVWLEAGPLPEVDLPSLLASASGTAATLVALDGVEDPQNLGAIVRVAEGTRVAGLVLTRRHAPPLSDAVSRASAGALEWLPICRVPNLIRALAAMKDAGFWILGADPAASVDLFSAPDAWLRGPRALVVGAEGPGLRRGVIGALDHRVRIPMAGNVASLNVSTASAVVLFELRRRDLARGVGTEASKAGPGGSERGRPQATSALPDSRSC
jgi:23S rRNA (guanosine2251-2'-O)-methyltransferase